jgi:hypothetical protein
LHICVGDTEVTRLHGGDCFRAEYSNPLEPDSGWMPKFELRHYRPAHRFAGRHGAGGRDRRANARRRTGNCPHARQSCHGRRELRDGAVGYRNDRQFGIEIGSSAHGEVRRE